jgi:hypothetical protein
MLQETNSSVYLPNAVDGNGFAYQVQETHTGGVTNIPSGTGCQPANGCCPNCGRCPHCGQTPINPPQVPYHLPAYLPPNQPYRTENAAYESYLKYDTDGAAHRANMQNRMDISH